MDRGCVLCEVEIDFFVHNLAELKFSKINTVDPLTQKLIAKVCKPTCQPVFFSPSRRGRIFF
jgi:hypothetical protein